MKELDKNKIFTEYRDNIFPSNPLLERRYTLTHSDETGDLFVTIGKDYAYDKTNSLRDEVYAEWVKTTEGYVYNVYIFLDGANLEETKRRNDIFRRELPYALMTLAYANKELLFKYPELKNSPINLYFISDYDDYNTIENWGSFIDYIS